jgi:hypothetical protein
MSGPRGRCYVPVRDALVAHNRLLFDQVALVAGEEEDGC